MRSSASLAIGEPVAAWTSKNLRRTCAQQPASGGNVIAMQKKIESSSRCNAGPRIRFEFSATQRWRRQSRANPSLNAEFPASREFTGNFIDSGPPARQQQQKKGIKTTRYEPIPYASEQGICFGSARN